MIGAPEKETIGEEVGKDDVSTVGSSLGAPEGKLLGEMSDPDVTDDGTADGSPL